MSMSVGAPNAGVNVGGFGGTDPVAGKAAAGFGRTTSLAPGIVRGGQANINF